MSLRHFSLNSYFSLCCKKNCIKLLYNLFFPDIDIKKERAHVHIILYLVGCIIPSIEKQPHVDE